MAVCDCDRNIRDWSCSCYDMGCKVGMEYAVENAWRSTMDETLYQRIQNERDRALLLVRGLVKYAKKVKFADMSDEQFTEVRELIKLAERTLDDAR